MGANLCFSMLWHMKCDCSCACELNNNTNWEQTYIRVTTQTFCRVDGYAEKLAKPQDCQNWGMCLQGMGTCTEMGTCLGQCGYTYNKNASNLDPLTLQQAKSY